MQQAGFSRNNSVFPDLAFSFDVSRLINDSPRSGSSSRVCVSPMVYCHPDLWPVKNENAYRHYIAKLADVVQRLIESRCEIVLVASDTADNHAITDLRENLTQRMGPACLDWLQQPPVESVEDFLRHVSKGQLLIASRLHGVILSHLIETPALALAYDRKVKSHMRVADQSDYCLSIDDFDVDQVLKLVANLKATIADERSVIQGKNREFRQSLDAQYDGVLSGRSLK